MVSVEKLNRVKGAAEEALDILIPRMSEHYGVEIMRPLVDIREDEYQGTGFGPESAPRIAKVTEAGQIRMGYTFARSRSRCGAGVAHKLGHITTHQSWEDKELWKKAPFCDLNAGLGMDFEMEGLDVLKQEKYMSWLGWAWQKVPQRLVVYGIDRILDPNVYVTGAAIVEHMKEKGVNLRELIVTPEAFEKDIWNFLRGKFPKEYEKLIK